MRGVARGPPTPAGDVARGPPTPTGAALNPATPVGVLEDILPELDMVLVMSVNPGFGGQRFIEGTYAKLDRLRALCQAVGAHPLIEVDGGISAVNIEDVARHGADVFVAGSAVFGSSDPAAEVQRLRALAQSGISAAEADAA